MDFDLSPRQREFQARVRGFMAEHVLPAVPTYEAELSANRWRLRAQCRATRQ